MSTPLIFETLTNEDIPSGSSSMLISSKHCFGRVWAFSNRRIKEVVSSLVLTKDLSMPVDSEEIFAYD